MQVLPLMLKSKVLEGIIVPSVKANAAICEICGGKLMYEVPRLLNVKAAVQIIRQIGLKQKCRRLLVQ